MSNLVGDVGRSERAALEALERAAGRLLDHVGRLTERVTAAEARSAELEALAARFTGGAEDSGRLLGRLRRLEAENADLRARVEAGREGVDRLLAKIRFLEDQR